MGGRYGLRGHGTAATFDEVLGCRCPEGDNIGALHGPFRPNYSLESNRNVPGRDGYKSNRSVSARRHLLVHP